MSAAGSAAATAGPAPRRGVQPIVWIAAGAVLLRIALLFGRGHYVAFDEGWYLLLGRNLWSGEGYALSGLRHVALSPLFPILSGGLGVLMGDVVWAGRLVAAVAAGLVTVPCWFLFHRLGGARAALVGAVFVALLPSLAPFVAPYWIGWDLWVGAEPLLHLLLFSGLALLVHSWEERSLVSAIGCGVSFALAYLARPEAVGVFGVAGIVALVLAIVTWARGRAGLGTERGAAPGAAPSASVPEDAAREPRTRWASRPWCFAACALAFVAVSTPYWLYLHDALGRWAITGRWVSVAPSTRSQARVQAAGSNRIEDMLWRGDDAAYVRSLYSLDASGTRLANGYWGVQPSGVGTGAPDGSAASLQGPPALEAPDAQADSSGAGPPGAGTSDPSAAASPSPTAGPAGEDPPSDLIRYVEALGVVFPWYLWLFVLVGLGTRASDRRLGLEALVGIPVVVTSVVIARSVAIDPRTQLFLAPLAAFYAAHGVMVVGQLLEKRPRGRIRGKMVPSLLIGALALSLLGTSLVRLGLSLMVGSPHHEVAAQNATVGEVIRRTSPADATVVSFHPAVALFAERDWRVLPVEPMDRIVRYARMQPAAHLVLSVFYPPQLRPLEEPHYLIVPVPSDLPDADRWRVQVESPGAVYALGALMPEE